MIKTTLSVMLIMLTLTFCIIMIQKQSINYVYSQWTILREDPAKYQKVNQDSDGLIIVYRVVDNSFLGRTKSFFVGDEMIQTIDINSLRLLYDNSQDTIIIYKPF